MLRRSAIVLVAAAALSSPAVAGAEPVAPRPGGPCANGLVGAMTWPADSDAPLVCAGAQWAEVVDPYPVSDRWLSYGPAMQLHGQGRRNPSMLSGDWTATPTGPENRCQAQQVAVVPGTPTVGPPQIDDGEPGRPLHLEVAPTMATIDLSGACLWQKVATTGSPSGW